VLKIHASDLNDAKTLAKFQEALLRNKKRDGFMVAAPLPLDMINDNFFRVPFYLPHDVSLGVYDVMAFYFQDGELVKQSSHLFDVRQEGMNAAILDFAKGQPLAYGLICVLLAIFAGWLSNRLKRLL